jgi:hypothetical protein
VKERVIVALRAATGNAVRMHLSAKRMVSHDTGEMSAECGGKRWRKLKGDATVRLANGTLRRAEIHWYEAHGVGKRGLKIKRFLD